MLDTRAPTGRSDPQRAPEVTSGDSALSPKLSLADLTPKPLWVAWRNEQRGDDFTKVPYISAARQAKADDPTGWLRHDEAVTVRDAIVSGARGGVGIELGPCGACWLAGVDLDTCRDPQTG